MCARGVEGGKRAGVIMGIISRVRAQRIVKHGSPYFPVSVGALAAGASEDYDLAAIAAAAVKYDPLDAIEVTNTDSASPVRLILDQGDSFIVPASTIRAVTSHPFRHVRIRNDGSAAIAAGAVTFLAQREPIKVDTFIRGFLR